LKIPVRAEGAHGSDPPKSGDPHGNAAPKLKAKSMMDGLGPAILFPVESSDYMGGNKWPAVPSAVYFNLQTISDFVLSASNLYLISVVYFLQHLILMKEVMR
jgi:hypothetical protein